MDVKNKYKEILVAKLANIQSKDKLEANDRSVREVLETCRELYKQNLDTLDENDLLRYGGKLLGHYANIGVTTSLKRAERDAHEQTYEELLSSMMILNKTDEIGITEAKSMAREQLKDFSASLIEAEQVYKAYESIERATQCTISFIQSAIRVKSHERINSPRIEGQEVS